MTSKDAKQVLREMIPTIAHYDREARQQIALRMAIEALEERPALLLLIDWAVQCDFGYDNFPEEYEQYKNEIEEKNLGYIDGMIYIAKKVTEGRQ